MSDDQETKKEPVEFDFAAFPWDTAFFDRRSGKDRRNTIGRDQPPVEKREKPERRKKPKGVDPTTFDRSYSKDEMEFMTAVEKFKNRTGKHFPDYREMLGLAIELGYRRVTPHAHEGLAGPHLLDMAADLGSDEEHFANEC